MKPIPKELRETLIQTGRSGARLAGTAAEPDFAPIVKLFTPDANCTWLLTELDPGDLDTVMRNPWYIDVAKTQKTEIASTYFGS